jgi:hypothetical protein
MVIGNVIYTKVSALAYNEPPEPVVLRDWRIVLTKDLSVPPILKAIGKCESGNNQNAKHVNCY